MNLRMIAAAVAIGATGLTFSASPASAGYIDSTCKHGDFWSNNTIWEDHLRCARKFAAAHCKPGTVGVNGETGYVSCEEREP